MGWLGSGGVRFFCRLIRHVTPPPTGPQSLPPRLQQEAGVDWSERRWRGLLRRVLLSCAGPVVAHVHLAVFSFDALHVLFAVNRGTFENVVEGRVPFIREGVFAVERRCHVGSDVRKLNVVVAVPEDQVHVLRAGAVPGADDAGGGLSDFAVGEGVADAELVRVWPGEGRGEEEQNAASDGEEDAFHQIFSRGRPGCDTPVGGGNVVPGRCP